MDAVVITGAIRRAKKAKLQSNYHHQQTITQLFHRPDALPVIQQCHSTEGKKSQPWKLIHCHKLSNAVL